MKTVKSTFSENSLILIISTVLIKIIGALFKIPLATDMFLGDLGFGYYSVAHDIFMPFYVLAISGLPSAVSHITAEYVAKGDTASIKANFFKTKKIFTILGVLFSVCTLILSVPISLSQETSKNALYSIFMILPSIFLCFVISVYRGYFEGHNNMYPTAISKVIEAVIKLVLGLILSFVVIRTTNSPAYASAAALLAISIGTLFSTVYLKLKFKKHHSVPFYENREEDVNFSAKTIFALAIPYVLASLSASIISVIDILTVKAYIANASAQYLQSLNVVSSDISTYLYGIRSKAFTLYYLVPNITMSLGVSAVPIIAQSRANGDTKSLKTACEFSLKLISLITLPASIGLTVLAKPIMNLLYSSTDSYSVNLLFLYGISAIFAGFSVPLTSIIQSLNLQKRAVVTIIIGIIIKIAVNLIAVLNPEINIYAAAIGSIVCYLYMTVDMLYVLKKHIGNIDFVSTILKPLISALVCGGAGFLISLISDKKPVTILAVLVAVLVYFAMIFITKVFQKSELSEIPLIKKVIR